MRVIAGEFRSRKILSMPGTDIRPTPDRLRESLFNILNPLLEDCVFVDAYAGTGSVGIEALSRGARHVIFIEKDKTAVELIAHNLASLGVKGKGKIIRGSASLLLAGIEADIVFLDPPYPKEKEYQASLDVLEARPPALTVVQHARRFKLEEAYGSLRRARLLTQGDNSLSFYKPEVIETSSSEQ
jgi:16S rRNA (guanine966-N2)-methyltransferase